MLLRKVPLLLSVAVSLVVLLLNPGGADAGDRAGGEDRGRSFACGPKLVCDAATQYCSRFSGGPVGVPASYRCANLPKDCSPTPTCECMRTEIGCTCTDSDGHITVTCTAP